MIHEENPFADIEDDPPKRFRGRLVAPVTIITAGTGERRVGLTVSSLFIIDGEPPLVHAVVGPNSDLFDEVQRTGHFVVHICHQDSAGLADIFAGIRPSPGGVFATTNVDDSEWGPVIVDLPHRAYCTTRSTEEVGWSGLLVGSLDSVEVTDITDPLAHYRGRYRKLY